ncbi:hypothetical protein AOLI_G00159150 [Acnodon oligacanthus]
MGRRECRDPHAPCTWMEHLYKPSWTPRAQSPWPIIWISPGSSPPVSSFQCPVFTGMYVASPLPVYDWVRKADSGSSPLVSSEGRFTKEQREDEQLKRAWENTMVIDGVPHSHRPLPSTSFAVKDNLLYFFSVISLREHMEEAQRAQQRTYNHPAQPREFQLGDCVLVLVPTTTCKFQIRLSGPSYNIGTTYPHPKGKNWQSSPISLRTCSPLALVALTSFNITSVLPLALWLGSGPTMSPKHTGLSSMKRLTHAIGQYYRTLQQPVIQAHRQGPKAQFDVEVL